MENDDLVDLFGKTARRLRRDQMERLAPLGLTPSLARALRAIVRAEAPLRMTDLATRLGVVPRSATGLVDSLEEAGLVSRSPDPSNRRSILVSPTDKGRTMRTLMGQARREAAEDLFSALSPEQRESLRALLAALNDPDA
ncbi:MarR family transcriptional regulator [Actinomadura barringtoniae]|uniref:MarR family transcriptional regulator n=1 Tax=Actinomadura barringtoniae TaxID=1427535 RepID=A0A939T193_9ACTN|nr:MarR family transcriptional regulator [Actinomadura barringtoniae]MBO2447066.1 MarR family transcriptional regulator [Actinomadura barringtoniae]